jgi:hypothetical protein
MVEAADPGRRKWSLLKTITWSSNSRRTDPTNLSAVPFCHGLRYAVRFGSIWKLLIACVTAGEKIESLS